MLPRNNELKQMAREKLKGRWKTPVLVILVCLGIQLVPGFIPNNFEAGSVERAGLDLVLSLYPLFVTGPLTFGVTSFFLLFIREEPSELGEVFVGFKQFFRNFGLYFLMMLFILLWSLLFIVPGIIAAYRYSQAYFILRDNPDMSPLGAIKESSRIMKGFKGKYFLLFLSFFGWIIVGIITLGIGMLWVSAYMYTTMALFYEKRVELLIAENPAES